MHLRENTLSSVRWKEIKPLGQQNSCDCDCPYICSSEAFWHSTCKNLWLVSCRPLKGLHEMIDCFDICSWQQRREPSEARQTTAAPVPRSKKTAPESVSLYCKARVRGMSGGAEAAGWRERPACRATCQCNQRACFLRKRPR